MWIDWRHDRFVDCAYSGRGKRRVPAQSLTRLQRVRSELTAWNASRVALHTPGIYQGVSLSMGFTRGV